MLEKHGLFTWGATAKESYERTIDAVTRAERYVVDQSRTVTISTGGALRDAQRSRAGRVLPRLRGVLVEARGRRAGARPHRALALDARDPRVPRPARRRGAGVEGLRDARPRPSHQADRALRPRPDYEGDGDALGARLEVEIAQYAREYDAYFEEMCRAKGVTKKKLDPWPRVVLLPGFGVCALGETAPGRRRRARRLRAHHRRHEVRRGGRRLRAGRARGPLRRGVLEPRAGQAQAGRPAGPLAVHRAGDGRGERHRHGHGSARRGRRRARRHGRSRRRRPRAGGGRASTRSTAGRVLPVAADVRDPWAVESAIAQTVDAWGGVDLVVSNAGTAPEGRLDTAAGQAALRDSLDLNCLSHATVARLAVAGDDGAGPRRVPALQREQERLQPRPRASGPTPWPRARSSRSCASTRSTSAAWRSAPTRSTPTGSARSSSPAAWPSRARRRGGSASDDYFRANLLGREVAAERRGRRLRLPGHGAGHDRVRRHGRRRKRRGISAVTATRRGRSTS